MKKKVIAAVLALCMTAGVLAGCGAPEPDEVETSAQESTETEEAEPAEAETAGMKRNLQRTGEQRKAALTESA